MKPVVVTTKHRGVFFGYLVGEVDTRSDSLRIERAQMCVYWSPDVRGVFGLAAGGPTKACKITVSVPAVELRDVTSVIEASEAAAVAWEKAPWSL